MTDEMKNTENTMPDEAFKAFVEKMTSDKDFRSDTLMMTVALMIRNIGAIEKRLVLLEQAVASAAEPGTENENGNGENE